MLINPPGDNQDGAEEEERTEYYAALSDEYAGLRDRDMELPPPRDILAGPAAG